MPREFPINKIRNIGIMAHIDAGKTTTTERILYYTGKIHKTGETHDGSSQMDWMDQERERGITITSAATTAHWQDCQINIIDTPGHVDFTAEVERSLRVLDGAVTVLDSKAGVEPQTETVWRQATDYRVPRIVFSNKMDATGADFDMSVNSIGERLGAKAAAIQMPVGKEQSFRGIIDLVTMQQEMYENDLGTDIHTEEIEPQFLDEAKEKRQQLLEAIADYDDDVMMKVLEGEEPTVEEIKRAIRKGVLTADFFPVMCGSAYKNKGVQLLLDAVVDYLPSPLDIGAVKGHLEDGTEAVREPSDEAPFSALAFKIATDPFVGRLTYFRVYSGHAEAGSYVLNATKDKRERLGRLVRMHANHRADITDVYTGDIAGAVGLKYTTTSDTLCDEAHPIELMQMVFPEPVIQMSVEPKTKADSQKMDGALQKLAEEDPTFKCYTDEETGQTIIAGVGELQLDILMDRMRREFKVEATAGKPQVAYRETITKEAEVEGKFVRQTGGHGQYGDVWIRFIPNPGQGFVFEDVTVGGSVPKEFVKPTQQGLEDALGNGLTAGYPVVDIKAQLFDGSYHEVDSSEQAYKIAASLALREAAKKCDPVILEPIMRVDVTAPAEYLGSVMGDLVKRRGQISNQEETGNAIKIESFVPLAEMFGYVTDLRSITQGRGTYIMQTDHYEQVPASIAKEIREKVNAKKA